MHIYLKEMVITAHVELRHHFIYVVCILCVISDKIIHAFYLIQDALNKTNGFADKNIR